MLETGLRNCDMWHLTKDNFPGGIFLYIKQEKTGDMLNVPISNRAQEIVAALPYRLFPEYLFQYIHNNSPESTEDFCFGVFIYERDVDIFIQCHYNLATGYI